MTRKLPVNSSVLYHLPASQISLQALWITYVHASNFEPPHLTSSDTDGSSEVHRTCLVQMSMNVVAIKGLQALENLSAFSHGLGLVAGLLAGTQVGGSVPHSINTGICLCKWIFNLLPT